MYRKAIIFGIKGTQLTSNERHLLKNDTNNIIEYINDIEIYKKKKKKYTFWDLIGK